MSSEWNESNNLTKKNADGISGMSKDEHHVGKWEENKWEKKGKSPVDIIDLLILSLAQIIIIWTKVKLSFKCR